MLDLTLVVVVEGTGVNDGEAEVVMTVDVGTEVGIVIENPNDQKRTKIVTRAKVGKTRKRKIAPCKLLSTVS